MNHRMTKRLINKLDRYAIENLTTLIVGVTALVSFFSLYFHSDLGIISLESFFSERWWNIFFFPFRVGDDYISLLIYLYIFWMFGTTLEQIMGHGKYNLYILSGLILVTIGSLIFPSQIGVQFVYLSVFLAVAYLVPDMEIYIFFILPLKIKWIGLLIVAFITYQTVAMVSVTQSVFPILGPVLGIGNFLIFFGKSILKMRPSQRKNLIRKINIQTNSNESKQSEYFHKCNVCGRTENDDPHLEFRFCNDCEDHEYCMDHLYSHKHIKVSGPNSH